MKKLVVLALFSLLALPVSAKVLVGKVDVQKILVTVKQGMSVRGNLKKDFEGKQKLLKKDEEKIRKSQEAYKKQSLVMNAKAKAKKEQELQQMIMKLQQKSMGFQKEIQAKEQKLKKPILDRLKVVIEEVSKKEKVEFTYEVSTAAFVYAKNEIDLTGKVIKAYDKKYPAK